MRRTQKLLATVGTASARQAERYLTAGNPTGLTGLRTHPCPRSALIYTYETTLQRLAALPASSAYAAATRALTQHRLDIVRGVEPAGYTEWAQRAKQLLESNKEAFGEGVLRYGTHAPEAFEARRHLREGFKRAYSVEDRVHEWDGIATEEPLEGLRTQEEREAVARRDEAREKSKAFEGAGVAWEDSPALDAGQIEELEDKIGAGLIEEVIRVAEGEARLVDTISQEKVWAELVEKAPENQWKGFARQTHMNPNETQAPPDVKK